MARHGYHRYAIETRSAPNLFPHPHRFNVEVKKLGLAKLLAKELFHYRGNLEVVLSRPCVYGVFSGPLGGFAPRERLCVGCLRCTTEHPEFVTIRHNPARKELGDDYFIPDHVDAVVYEAETGHIPIKGQGYRGKFGGSGWDGMWTDMSEIVRPTRDGIHGREFISTVVDMGAKAPFVRFNAEKQPIEEMPNHSIPIPLLFDALPPSVLNRREACTAVCEAARHLQTFAIVPLDVILKYSLKGSHIIPLMSPNQAEKLAQLNEPPLLLELEAGDERFHNELKKQFPQTQLILRSPFKNDELIKFYRQGVRLYHLTANYHGKRSGRFVQELIRDAHRTFVEAGCRGEVTLIGSGGIIAAEHLPKAIICGLDAVALDTAILVALQAYFDGPCVERKESRFKLPPNLTVEWGAQRLKNLAGSWRDQLLEILGAMGLREVRRLRGEIGRALFQKDLEKEAFTGIQGYDGTK
ncbi:MAG: hypothetical protein LLG04_18480 [Parachlamydia sp.]|nr:hypothetical protein [Parachlamydia sp.]